MSQINLHAVAAAVAAKAPDYNVATQGGEYTPPAQGVCRLRLVSYVECGEEFKPQFGKTEDRAWFTFELSGPKHEPRVLDDGTIVPHRITVKVSKGRNEKSNFYKLFKLLNWEGKATHPAELLGQPYIGVVHHGVFESAGKTITFAKLRDDNGFTIRPPRFEDPDTGEERLVKVAPAVSELRLFTWDAPEEYLGAMWESIHIDGDPDAERDPNVYQNAIKTAENYEGSPIQRYLASIGEDTPVARPPARRGMDADEAAVSAAAERVTATRKAAPAKAAVDEDDTDEAALAAQAVSRAKAKAKAEAAPAPAAKAAAKPVAKATPAWEGDADEEDEAAAVLRSPSATLDDIDALIAGGVDD